MLKSNNNTKQNKYLTKFGSKKCEKVEKTNNNGDLKLKNSPGYLYVV